MDTIEQPLKSYIFHSILKHWRNIDSPSSELWNSKKCLHSGRKSNTQFLSLIYFLLSYIKILFLCDCELFLFRTNAYWCNNLLWSIFLKVKIVHRFLVIGLIKKSCVITLNRSKTSLHNDLRRILSINKITKNVKCNSEFFIDSLLVHNIFIAIPFLALLPVF